VCDGVQKRKAAQPRVNRDPATPWGKRRKKESFGLSKASCRAENAVQVTPMLLRKHCVQERRR